jgi:glyoxylase-like metal-dependent hydrolase (beta-lactamase superfamily II)
MSDMLAGAPGVPEITPEELIRCIEAGDPIRILDVRAPNYLAGSRIELLPSDRFTNIRGSEVLAMGDAIKNVVAPDGPVAVVCARGNDSKVVAHHLNELGIRALSVSGGMAAYGDALARRTLAPPPGFDHLIQFDRVAKGALGYLLAAGGEALIVDPPRRPEPYLAAAQELGLRVIGVADTHAHADYISGGPAISRHLRVPYHLHASDAVLPYDGSAAKVPYTAIEDGQELRVGGAAVRVLHTPGHTEGSVCFEAGDVVMTGDLVFIRSVGRPDLGGKMDEWTPILWKSLERVKREWDGARRILPAHYSADSERERDRSVGRAFAAVRADNEPLGLPSEAEFVAWIKRKVTPSPEVYRKIKSINLGLIQVWDMEARELDTGKNECAVG